MSLMSRRHAIERTHHPESVRARRDVQADFRRGDVFVSEDLPKNAEGHCLAVSAAWKSRSPKEAGYRRDGTE